MFTSTIAMTLIWASFNESGESTPEQTQIYLALGIVFAVVCLLGLLQCVRSVVWNVRVMWPPH